MVVFVEPSCRSFPLVARNDDREVPVLKSGLIWQILQKQNPVSFTDVLLYFVNSWLYSLHNDRNVYLDIYLNDTASVTSDLLFDYLFEFLLNDSITLFMKTFIKPVSVRLI